ncbi:MAG: DUF1549 and DUF1553 domain-containing protein, partial [Chthonomonadales bacterium]
YLASPHYGERWARHWLDVARYAESEGFKSDEMRPNVWRYRDYVIKSLNADKTYDRFIQEQIAGDELFPESTDALVATGFNIHGPDESNATDLLQRRQEILNDITDTVGSTIMGLTVGCARCHNHKYDPILQTDYYRLQAFFAGIKLHSNMPLIASTDRASHDEKLKIWQEKTADARARMAKLEEPARAQFFKDRKKRFSPDVQEAIETAPEKRTPLQWILYYKGMPQLELGSFDPKNLKPDALKEYNDCKSELAKYASLKPAEPLAWAVTDVGPQAPTTHLLATGVYNAFREETPPGVLSLLDPSAAVIPPVGTATSGRRAAFAHWLTRPENPLTARVMVNRMWQHHFGRGIVGTPGDFGSMGEQATHPELLDWLATQFTSGQPGTSAWSLKKMHRLMVTSNAYRQASVVNAAAMKVDPENRLLWRFARKRLEGEAIRDAMLTCSGDLNPKMGGPSIFPELPSGITTRGGWTDSKDPAERNRRSIYVFVKRNLRYPFFEAFDMPDTHEACGRRMVTTSAPQALFLLNDDFSNRSAKGFAKRLVSAVGADAEKQIDLAYRIAFSRLPDAEERERAMKFIVGQSKLAGPSDQNGLQALTDFCHALLNSHEFVYTD